MSKVSSDFLYNDKAYLQMLAGKKPDSDNIAKIKMLSSALSYCISSSLTEKQRLYIELYYFKRLNIPQIAKKMKVNKSTVSRTLSRARDKMSHQLEFIALQ